MGFKQKIKYNWFGIASRQGDLIYINKHLLKYPILHNKILIHELEHTSGYAWHDFLIDSRNNHLKGLKVDYYKFILKYPSTWIEFIPFWRYENKWVVNPALLLLYGVLGIIGGLLLWNLI